MDYRALLEQMKTGLLGPPQAGAQGTAQQAFGQGGIAGMANAQRQKAYKDYVDEVLSKGDQPMQFREWLGVNFPQEYGPKQQAPQR
jgi:hypothetical protein